MAEAWLDEIMWDSRGLAPAVTVHAETGALLGHDWMNRQALILTITRGQAVYCRPTSGETWQPAPLQGGPLRVAEIRSDRSRACLLLKVRPEGALATAMPFAWRLLEARWQPDAAAAR